MNHTNFLIWMLLCPLVTAIEKAIYRRWIGLQPIHNPPTTSEAIASLTELFIYIFVAVLLWKWG